jgi:hypothetical protein
MGSSGVDAIAALRRAAALAGQLSLRDEQKMLNERQVH